MDDKSNRDLIIFTEAQRLPSEERVQYLERACADDAALRLRVEKLLESYEQAGDFLEEPAHGESGGRATVGMQPGDRIARYKLLQQIGEGGCGVVFMAEQEEPVRRKVAVKIIKPGMDTKSVIARFEAERQALALMDHPNIAKVFDAGATETGRPYFVMELVRGCKLTTYCDEHALNTKARLELFVTVCHAVQHAHQKGIIHRDLKPSNVLVTTTEEGKALPKVIDFGVAKATTGQPLTDKTVFTAFEMLIGTPAYMSPEQASLTSVDVDTRTDIYSLGVLLYELLTGTTPFSGHELLKAGLDEIRRVILNREPQRPSTRLSTMIAADLTYVAQRRQAEPPKLIRAVRGDLDWIVIKALEKDRNRRYQTAREFAEEMRRHLAHETITARPPSNWYKLRKAASRNKVWFGAIAAVIAVLTVALAVVTVSLNREKHIRRDADQARQQALADKNQATREAARSAQVTCFLGEMLEGVGPSVALGRDTTMLKEILDKTASRLDVELSEQPEIEADLRMRLGRTYWELGQYEQSEAMFRKALALRVRLFGDENEAASDALNELGHVLILQGKNDEGEQVIRRALDSRRRLLGNEHLKVAESMVHLGAVLWRQNRLPETEAVLRESLVIRRKLLGDDHPVVGDTLIGLGSVHFTQGEHKKAEEWFRRAMDTLQKALGEDHHSVASAMQNLASALFEQHRYEEAESLLRRVVTVRRKNLGEHHPAVVGSLHSLARCLSRQGKYAEAENEFRRVLALREKKDNEDDAEVIQTVQELTNVLRQQRKFDEADQRVSAILPPERALNPKYLGLLRDRGEFFARRGRWKEAVADATLVLEREPHEHLHFHTLAPLLVQVGDVETYRDLCKKILSQFGDTTDPYVADRMAKDCLIVPVPGLDLARIGQLAQVSVTQGANRQAMPFFQACKALAEYRQGHFASAVEWASKSVENQFPYSALESYAVLAMAHCQMQNYEAARAAYAKGTEVLEFKIPKLADGDLGGDWRDWIIANTLLAEAKTLMDAISNSDSNSAVK